MNKNLVLSFLIIFALTLFLFLPSLNYYFFQDDWFVLNWATTGSLSSLLGLRTDIIYYRPISMPLFFVINYKLFGLNPLPYHILVFAIFFALVVSIYLLLKALVENRRVALFIAFLYATWPIHFMGLSWLSTTSYILGPFFIVLTYFSFIKYLRHKKRFFYLISFSLFLLALGSSEFAIILPIIILIWGLFTDGKNYFKNLWPFFLICLLYLILRVFIFPAPVKDQYQIQFNSQVINNLSWYIAWFFGFPESFKDRIFPNFAAQSLRNLIQFWSISVPTILFFLICIKLIVGSFRKNFKAIVFGFLWLIIGLSPVILFTNHAYTGYLSFAGIGVLYLLAISLMNQKPIWWGIVAILWMIISINNLQFTYSTHWVKNEQAISKAYISYTKQKIKNPLDNAVFIFRPANENFARYNNFTLVENEDTTKLALSDQNAVQVIYKNATLKSLFRAYHQKVELPKDTPVFDIDPQ